MNRTALHELEEAFAERNTFLLVLLGILSLRRRATRLLRRHAPVLSAKGAQATPALAETERNDGDDVLMLALLGGVALLDHLAGAEVRHLTPGRRKRAEPSSSDFRHGLLR